MHHVGTTCPAKFGIAHIEFQIVRLSFPIIYAAPYVSDCLCGALEVELLPKQGAYGVEQFANKGDDLQTAFH